MEYRLQQAAYLLLHTENTVQQIGECCGFEDNSYFAKSFRAMYQMTPTEYRRRRFQEWSADVRMSYLESIYLGCVSKMRNVQFRADLSSVQGDEPKVYWR